MTKLPLDEIQARTDAATPGPWTVQTYGGYDRHGDVSPPEWVAKYPDGNVIIGDAYPGDGADVYFIAHAREDVPALIAEIRRLTTEQSEDDGLSNDAAFLFMLADSADEPDDEADDNQTLWPETKENLLAISGKLRSLATKQAKGPVEELLAEAAMRIEKIGGAYYAEGVAEMMTQIASGKLPSFMNERPR